MLTQPWSEHRFALRILPDRLAVCRLDVDSPTPVAQDLSGRESNDVSGQPSDQRPGSSPVSIPPWAVGAGLWAILRREGELSIVCDVARVPQGTRHEPGWRALVIDGCLDFSQIGVLANLTGHLASAGVSVFALSTYDTDVLLVQEEQLKTAEQALRAGGHAIEFAP